jgi:hypothetical protein
MNIKNALVRGVRTAAQTLAAGLSTLGIVNATDLQLAGDKVWVMIVTAGVAGAISFLQNLAEDNSSLSIPK